MSTIYQTDIGTVISLNTGITITGATGLTIEVKKPSGVIASWAGAIGADTVSVEHTIASGELDELGWYSLQAKLSLGGGTWRGAVAQVQVKPVFK